MSVPTFAIHLSFDGNCAEALRFYASALGGRILTLMPYAGSPMGVGVPPAQAERILHGTLDLGGQRIMGADAVEGHPFQPGQGYSISLGYPSVAEAELVYRQLAEGGTVVLPFSPTFWARGFGMCVDRFGVSWMIGGEEAVDASAAP